MKYVLDKNAHSDGQNAFNTYMHKLSGLFMGK